MKNTYLVDQNSGPFKSIQEAIDTARPFSQIKISPGIYIENLFIAKNGLTLMPKNENNDVTIISVKGPTISIEL
jgi:F-box protein 11